MHLFFDVISEVVAFRGTRITSDNLCITFAIFDDAINLRLAASAYFKIKFAGIYVEFCQYIFRGS